MDTIDDPVSTIPEFCARNRISRTTYYMLRPSGQGPVEMVIGGAVRITAEAELEWRARMQRKPDEAAVVAPVTTAPTKLATTRKGSAKQVPA